MEKAFALLLLAGATLLAAPSGANGQQGVWNIITRPVFEDMLKHRRDSGCQGAFYTYDAFIEAASKFPGFGTTGNDETRRRELAAFFGQTSHETTGTACTLHCSSLNYLSIVSRCPLYRATTVCVQEDGQLLQMDNSPGDTAE
jgi:hypothetical protein